MIPDPSQERAAPPDARAPSPVARARAAAPAWRCFSLGERLRVVARARADMAERALELAASCRQPWRRDDAETITAELLPLLDACRFLEREAEQLLRPRSLGARGRPLWLFGTRGAVHRDPFGVVLVLGPANYPLLLAGVQALQALVAGNTVVLKPGRGAAPSALALAEALGRAGLPEDVLVVTDESVESASAALDEGVDALVLTGSAETGAAVAERIARRPLRTIMELSGCDAVIVREDADLDVAARSIAFALTLNGGFTCIAPRRVIAHPRVAAELERRLVGALEGARRVPVDPAARARVARLVGEARLAGARLVAGALEGDASTLPPLVLADVPHEAELLRADLPLPFTSLLRADDDSALALVAEHPRRLGAGVFGEPAEARRLAERLPVGVVVINDLVVPTVDPRAPFGGRGASGHGVTRGREGLLELTTPRTVVERRGRLRAHLDPPAEADADLFAAFARLAHGRGFGARLGALRELVSAARRRAGRPSGERR